MAHIRKIQNTAKVKISAIDETSPSTKTEIDKEELDISAQDVSCAIS